MSKLVSFLHELLPVLDRLSSLHATAHGRSVTLELSGVLVLPLGIAGNEHDVERAVVRLELLAKDQAVLQEVRVVLRSGLKRAGYAMAGGDRTAAEVLVREARKAGVVAEVRWATAHAGSLPARLVLAG
jgi:hypothetical protein